MGFFWQKTEEKTQKRDDSATEKLSSEVENLKIELKQLKANYGSWLEEKEQYIRQLRDRIEKKLSYNLKKQETEPVRDLVKKQLMMKTLKHLGFKPQQKELYTRTPIDDEDGTQES